LTIIVPPPWQLTGSGTILLYRFPPEWALGQGWVPPELHNAFVGGVGAVVLADYTASGVGPYREALFVPGQFRVGGRLRSVITSIYVSTQPSVDSGRANWSIPKQLAAFEPRPGGLAASLGGRPILEVEAEPFGPALPLDTAWSPVPVAFFQSLDGRRLVTRPAARGAIRLARLRHAWADPAHFPDIAPFRPLVAVRATGFTLTFPVPEEA
jgi:hypothetical protein